MLKRTGYLCVGAFFVGLFFVPTNRAADEARPSTQGFITGPAAEAWQHWEAAMQAILVRDQKKSEAAFGELLALKPSPFRIALLSDYTVRRTKIGGAVLLFEDDLKSAALGPQAKEVAQLLTDGREQMNEADDGFYFCQLGRFDVAYANFRKLLDSHADSVALLEFVDRVPKRRDILIQLLNDPVVGDVAKEILRQLDRGERDIKADPTRIKENIGRLGGTPRAFENAVDALKDSGEYAIPFIVQTLRDPTQRDLLQPILRCLPQIDHPGLNPLVMALRINDDVTKGYVIAALGKIGYLQAVPYLLQLAQDPNATSPVRAAVSAALDAIQARGTAFDRDLPAALAFYALAEDYYADKSSLAADPRLDNTNVWYWRDDLLQNIEVPTAIFNEVMALRCCEEAMRLDPGLKPALALWLAANFRREAQLPAGLTDQTRPPDYPPAAYFAQSAGAEYCLMTLARAVDTSDPAVALGAVEALRQTAGPASLVGDASGRLPLAEALSFANRMVRVRAGLTLGLARPDRPFQNYQNLMPVLSEALMLYAGGRNALVVDPDAASANVVAAGLREEGYEVLVDAQLYPGLEKVRTQLPGLDVICLASNMQQPVLTDALTALRSEFRFRSTPVILVTKPGAADTVRDLVRADYRLGEVSDQPAAAQLSKAVAAVSQAVGGRGQARPGSCGSPAAAGYDEQPALQRGRRRAGVADVAGDKRRRSAADHRRGPGVSRVHEGTGSDRGPGVRHERAAGHAGEDVHGAGRGRQAPRQLARGRRHQEDRGHGRERRRPDDSRGCVPDAGGVECPRRARLPQRAVAPQAIVIFSSR